MSPTVGQKLDVVLSQKSPQNLVAYLAFLRLLRRTRVMTATATPVTGVQLGYARVSTGHQSLDQQLDALTAAGVEPNRVYTDKLSGTSTREQRPGLAALLDYARAGDAIVVVGIDRLGRNAAEVMTTIRELGERNIVLRSLREGIDTTNAPAAWWPAS
jgi:predicted site-specific integrase-resolvase